MLVKIANVFLLVVPVVYAVISYWDYWGMDNHGIPYHKAVLALLLAAGGVVAVHKMGKAAWVRASSLLAVWCAALLMNLVGNAEMCWYLPQISMSVPLGMGVLCAMFAALSRYAIIPLVVLLLLESVRSYCVLYLGIDLNPHVMAEIAAASKTEIIGFATVENIFMVSLGVILYSCGFYWLYRLLRHESRVSLACTGIVLMAAVVFARCLVCPQFCNKPCGFWPISSVLSLMSQAKEAHVKNTNLVYLAKTLPSPAEKPSSISTLQGGEGVICILHVGESVRADRLSINGWKNDTTPWLRQQEHLVNFPVCIAAAPETMKSFIGIMTNDRFNVEEASQKKYLPTTGSVLDLFDANGFNCVAFWGSSLDDNDNSPFTQIFCALTRRCKDRFQEKMGDPMRQAERIVEFCKAHPNKNLFLLVNNEGSHMPFMRYDTENPPFKPTHPDAYYQNPQYNPQKAQEANNAYDNTIHYTDSCIKRIVEGVHGRPLMYMYVSDHGEYIGHDGLWSRGTAVSKPQQYYSTEGCRVPLLIYISEEMKQLHSHFGEAAGHLRGHTSMTVAHEHVFHTLLGFFGISTPYYDASLDLSSPQAKPYTGPQPQNNGKPLEEDWH